MSDSNLGSWVTKAEGGEPRAPAELEGAEPQVVGISEMRISCRPEEILVTYSLGSCLGVTLYDPFALVGGMIHCMLPLSKVDPGKANGSPCMFVDTGMPRFLQAMFDRGARRQNLVVKVAGAASLMEDKARLDIGRRNYMVLRKVLWKNDLMIVREHVGGLDPRCMYLRMRDGASLVRIRGRLMLL